MFSPDGLQSKASSQDRPAAPSRATRSESMKASSPPLEAGRPKPFPQQTPPHPPTVSEAHQRIVFLGKTGVGKSSLANILTKDNVFEINHSADSGTTKCQKKSTTVSGRSITVIDTPGFFDTNKKNKNKEEILRCITEASPGPHVFLILLKVEKYTEHEKAVIQKIREYFSEESFRFSAVVFTHGDQLPEGMKIKMFVDQTDALRDLVKKCGGRCHVIDSKYWNKSQNNYRNNEFQVAELFKTIDKIIEENNGGYYTNEMLENVEEQIAEEEKHISETSDNLTPEEIRERAKEATRKKLLITFGATAGGALLGALCGGIAVAVFAPALAVGAAVAGGAVVAAAVKAAAVGAGVGAAVGMAVGVIGARVSGDNTAETAEDRSSPTRGSEPEAAEGGDIPLTGRRGNDLFNRRGGYHRLSQQKEHQS